MADPFLLLTLDDPRRSNVDFKNKKKKRNNANSKQNSQKGKKIDLRQREFQFTYILLYSFITRAAHKNGRINVK